MWLDRWLPEPEPDPPRALLQFFRDWQKRAAMMRDLNTILALHTVPHPKGQE